MGRMHEERRLQPASELDTVPTRTGRLKPALQFPHEQRHLHSWLPASLGFPKSVQAITFRLADSVPAKVIYAWKRKLASIAG